VRLGSNSLKTFSVRLFGFGLVCLGKNRIGVWQSQNPGGFLNQLAVLYEYQPIRAGEHPRNFLKGFKGNLHSDGCAEYHAIPDVTLCVIGKLIRKSKQGIIAPRVCYSKIPVLV
jgi:hypothetical protein